MDKNTIYITTAIPYVNDKPHIGHAMDFIYADILARYNRGLGHDVKFSTGTDEHGQKIAEKAEAAKLTPQQFVDNISSLWIDFGKKLNITNDLFVRTTDPAHIARAQMIWTKLSPYIYKKSYVGLYCVGCEAFYTETVAKANNYVCPDHNRPYDKVEEENYFFKLSAFNKQLAELYSNGTVNVLPANRTNEIVSLIKAGLEDVSISRPKSKLEWGIPVPGDETHVMYVWFEALMNYITVIGFPEHAHFTQYWPADYQVIGKDILKFHGGIWQAMLLALEVGPTKNILVHGHVTASGQKMSKTIGNVIDPIDLITDYGADTLRYFLSRHSSLEGDSDYSEQKYRDAYNNEIANDLGNLVSRLATMCNKYLEGIVGALPNEDHDDSNYHLEMQNARFDKAIDLVWQKIQMLNQYIEAQKPWAIAKTDDYERLREVLAYAVSEILRVSRLLDPFMPDTASKIKDVFAGPKIIIGEIMFPKKLDPSQV